MEDLIIIPEIINVQVGASVPFNIFFHEDVDVTSLCSFRFNNSPECCSINGENKTITGITEGSNNCEATYVSGGRTYTCAFNVFVTNVPPTPEPTPEPEEFVSLTQKILSMCPPKYVHIGETILKAFSMFGEDLIKECNVTKTTKGQDVLNCWLIYNTGIAAYSLGEYKKADLIMNYVSKQLNNLYKVSVDANDIVANLEFNNGSSERNTSNDITKNVFGTYAITTSAEANIQLTLFNGYKANINGIKVNDVDVNLNIIRYTDDSIIYISTETFEAGTYIVKVY